MEEPVRSPATFLMQLRDRSRVLSPLSLEKTLVWNSGILFPDRDRSLKFAFRVAASSGREEMLLSSRLREVSASNAERDCQNSVGNVLILELATVSACNCGNSVDNPSSSAVIVFVFSFSAFLNSRSVPRLSLLSWISLENLAVRDNVRIFVSQT